MEILLGREVSDYGGSSVEGFLLIGRVVEQWSGIEKVLLTTDIS